MATNKPNFSRRVSEFSAATLDKREWGSGDDDFFQAVRDGSMRGEGDFWKGGGGMEDIRVYRGWDSPFNWKDMSVNSREDSLSFLIPLSTADPHPTLPPATPQHRPSVSTLEDEIGLFETQVEELAMQLRCVCALCGRTPSAPPPSPSNLPTPPPLPLLSSRRSDIGNSNTISKEVRRSCKQNNNAGPSTLNNDAVVLISHSLQVMDDLVASRNDLRQYVGNLEKFQFVKVDAIITADLQSGKEEARTRRKVRN
jgi:hypothetical protein